MSAAAVPPGAAAQVLFGAGRAGRPLYCVLDAAQAESIYPRLRTAGAEAEILPLYEGGAASELAGVAPYLVRLDGAGALFDWIWGAGWGRSWGIFATADVPGVELRAHFRRITRIRTEGGRTLLFRFYDPRVLAAFAPVCDEVQLGQLFGPVASYFAEQAGGAAIEQFSVVQGRLWQQRHTL